VERNEIFIGFSILAVSVAILDSMIESIKRRRAVPRESLCAREVVFDACTITILNQRKRARIKTRAFAEVLASSGQPSKEWHPVQGLAE